MSVRATIMALAIAAVTAVAAFGLYIIIPVLAKAILTVPLSIWELVGSIALLVASIKVNLYL